MKAAHEDVRQRILLAARAEFAQFGLAGARIDRIAAQAHASKERLYAHFSDKASLFQAVLDLNGKEFYEAVVIRPDDVPRFVGDIFDHSLSSPEHIRMLTWARLDGLNYKMHSGESNATGKIEALVDAQRGGFVDQSWDPEELLPLLFALGLAWANSPDPQVAQSDERARANQRAAAVEAARRLIARRQT
jgi:AcrR family transcriptional regulator